MTNISSTTETVDFTKVFNFNTADGPKAESRHEPQTKMLFDELWLEGELAILFGDTGKTALAVQIGESIARGRPVEPMRMDAAPQKVLYLDLGLTQKQFDLRYCSETEDDEGEILTEDYEFSDNFCRVEMQPDMTASGVEAYRTLAQGFEWIVKKTEPKVLILDNITCLRQSAHGSRGEVLLIKALDRLKRQYGLSILVLVNTSRRNVLRELSVADLGSSCILSNFADSVFAVGQAEQRGPFRYIKHLRAKSTEVIYDSGHTPTFELCKIDGKFLGLSFDQYTDEAQHFDSGGNEIGAETYHEIQKLSAEGKSIRAIAVEMEMSKSSVHRFLNMEPPAQESNPQPIDWDEVRRQNRWFPGSEVYDAILEDPIYNDIYDREDDEAYRLRRESYLVESARAKAKKRYREEGIETTFKEVFAEVSRGHSFPYRYDELVTKEDIKPAVSETPAIEPVIQADKPEFSDDKTDEVPDNSTPDGIPPGLERELDGYGRPIFVKSRNSQGKPHIYFQQDQKGSIRQYERRPAGIFVTVIKPAVKTKNGRPEQNGNGEVPQE